MAIKRIVVVKDCPICDGRENGCHDCDNTGELRGEIDFHEFMFGIVELMQHYDYIQK